MSLEDLTNDPFRYYPFGPELYFCKRLLLTGPASPPVKNPLHPLPTTMMLDTITLAVLCLLAFTTMVVHSSSTLPYKIGLVKDNFFQYATTDTEIFTGVVYWAHWINSVHGGLQYNNTVRKVEVFSIDASSTNGNLTNSLVAQGYDTLITKQGVDLVLGPTNTQRTSASISVSEKYGLINLVVGAQTDGIFKSNNTKVFTSVTPNALVAPTVLQLLVREGAKTFIIFMRADSIAVNTGTSAIQYLVANGLTMIKHVWINVSSVDATASSNAVKAAVNEHLPGVQADIFIYSSVIAEYDLIVTTIDDLQPKGIKSCVFLTGSTRYQQTLDHLGHAGDYWLTYTRFDPSYSFGTLGQYGGTTAQFIADYTSYAGKTPDVYDALAPAILMTWWRAVTICDCVDSATVAQTMKNMSYFETFAFPIKYFANGTNMYPQIIPIQYVNGEGRPVTSLNIIYPMKWRRSDAFDSKIIAAVAVPIAVVVLLVVLAGVYYIRKQRSHVVKALAQAEAGERRNYRIDYAHLNVKTMIGAGGFGYVYRGEYRGADVAIKKLKTQKMTKAQLDQFAQESSIMVGLRHPNILLFMGVCLEPLDLCIITEFMSRGSLYDIVHNDKITIPFPLAINMILDILKGIQFIHSAGIIHRDLKSPNLLVDKSWRIKIADFGLSCVKSQEDDDAQISLLWTAPEILAKQKGCYTEKSDVYSIGIMVWEMLARRTPFDDTIAAAISPAVVAGKRPALNPEWNSALLQFIKRCWAPLPSDRHSVVEARHTIESIDVDPDFEIGGSSTTLDKYVEKAAPPPSGHVTFVFSTVAHSAELWKHDPHSMMRALLLHNEVINDLIAREKGYKVKSNGDSYLISFPVSVQAVSFCLKAQRLLLDVDWPASLLQHPLAAPQRSDEGDVFMRGLSLKMGIHIAQVMVDRDSTTENVDYRGDGMTVAPKLASLAPPGTIFITADMYSNVMASIESLEPFVIESVGTRVFKKGADAVILYQMVPQLLSVRNEVRDYLDQPEIYESNAAGKFEFIEHKDRFAIEYEELEIGAKIGAGSFGEVKAGSLRGRKVAIKQLIRHKVTDVAQIELRAECAVLQSMDHKNVIRFEGMCFKLPNICLVTEFMEKGSLAQVLYNNGDTISWNIRRRMLLDIAEGMAYLHSKDIIHRDVKSSNMLVAADDTVKIADFGFSRIKAENQTMTQCGTVAWTAPEIFEGNHYTEKADVYSYAIIIWEVINRKKPWEGVHAMRLTANVIAGKRPPPPTPTSSNAPRQVLSLMESCWQHDPRSRPTFQHIITTLLHEVT